MKIEVTLLFKKQDKYVMDSPEENIITKIITVDILEFGNVSFLDVIKQVDYETSIIKYLLDKQLSYLNPKYDCFEYQKSQDILNDVSMIPEEAFLNDQLLIEVVTVQKNATLNSEELTNQSIHEVIKRIQKWKLDQGNVISKTFPELQLITDEDQKLNECYENLRQILTTNHQISKIRIAIRL